MRPLFLDVDTQLDFLYPAGALYVPGAERIVQAVSVLNRHAAAEGFALLSTVDAHAEDDPEFRAWPAHCVAGTLGQRKPAETLVGQRLVEKQSVDCFTVPELVPLIESFQPDRFVVYGVVTEICVLNAALGLRRFGKPVELVAEAVKALTAEGEARVRAEFAFVTMDQCLRMKGAK
jgi:nicotinamidase/pyrazinamidase